MNVIMSTINENPHVTYDKFRIQELIVR